MPFFQEACQVLNQSFIKLKDWNWYKGGVGKVGPKLQKFIGHSSRCKISALLGWESLNYMFRRIGTPSAPLCVLKFFEDKVNIETTMTNFIVVARAEIASNFKDILVYCALGIRKSSSSVVEKVNCNFETTELNL